ncbi:helix-turn-helix transcriptional regulator [Streptomyces orinoci]|uniref:Helix-turn-helix transcriptional regulator n=1 Tax=Streptomyces orinoci TaxID=67339 RepID=A0ABV3K8Q5_STRON|nr:helix-turn-helix transcriptional regulator [Streptomyces orinoci]
MATEVESLRRALVAEGQTVRTVGELGALVSHRVGLFIPHDGYLLTGLDPLTRAAGFYAKEHFYGAQAAQRLYAERPDIDPFPCPFASLLDGPRRVGVLNADSPEHRRSERLHDVMAGEGFGCELRVALTHGGLPWGLLTLLRTTGSRPFTAEEEARAERLAGPLATALKVFGRGLCAGPNRHAAEPGVVVVGPDDTVRMTPTAVDWLAELNPHPLATAQALGTTVWTVVWMARYSGAPAVSRIPTPGGWVAVQAQLLGAEGGDEVVVTIRPASGAGLLPTFAAWHDITRRERAVAALLLEGLPAKRIARRLGMSPHTVNDHLKAVYRKTGVSGRDELVAVLLAGVAGAW